jgi:tryptophan synthase alpha chain
MNRINHLFEQKKEPILNIFLTAGYPQLESTVDVVLKLDRAGVDLIELGMPYSDPLADGPTIQKSSEQALRNGMSVEVLFQQVAEIRKQSDIPLVLMGYYNPVLQYGAEAFFNRCAALGIDGLILPDLPIWEYEERYQSLFESLGLNISFLITPQTSEARIQKIDHLNRGFIYMVADASITGASGELSDAQLQYFERIQNMNLEHPRLIGFGISDAKTFHTACQYAEGAIVGSAFIRSLEAGQEPEEFIGFLKGRHSRQVDK